MRRNMLNFLVDAVTLLTIFAMVATGLVIRFVLLPGTGGRHGGRGLVLWGMGRHDWGDLHFWVSVALGVLLVIHVALHWSWVCMTVRRSLGGKDAGQLTAVRRNAYGIGFLVALLALFGGFTWYADSTVQEGRSPATAQDQPQRPGTDVPEADREEGHGAANELIRGSMTLAEVESATGVSVATLKSELGLPRETPADDRLGRLGRQYGFNVEKVRDVVARHRSQSDER